MSEAVAIEVPGATADEVAAIMAAYEALWPRPVAAVELDTTPAWRFSGRWWSASPLVGRASSR